MKNDIEPLAIAANTTQGDDTTLAATGLCLGKLYYTYSHPTFEPRVRETIHASLEKRWGKADQDAFIMAIVVNPYIRNSIFNRKIEALTPHGLHPIAQRLYKRFYKAEPNKFSDKRMHLREFEERRKAEHQRIDLVKVWRMLDNRDTAGRNSFVKFSSWILSIIANTGATERVWSRFGINHTKLRNRLHLEKVRKTSIVGMDIQRHNVENGLVQPRRKWKFGALADEANPAELSSTTTSSHVNNADLDDGSDDSDDENPSNFVDTDSLR
ncbi:hypothetical protein BV22DRAFT_1108476 [Leucogyrophana mollusca]|uniref:Uncharacterized protein n=1 Tax=Leucogyrophana mollusca TaxID=85980 RepID=A0ACB8AX21_9AGAM|nr:hypothetical protein BV22DRAFT_1108476 [Leucogyrophana mollusca]